MFKKIDELTNYLNIVEIKELCENEVYEDLEISNELEF